MSNPTAAEEVKPAEAVQEAQPEQVVEASSAPEVHPEPVVEPQSVPEEPKVPAASESAEEVKPETKTKPAEETSAMTTPSVVKDIPASKMVSEALPPKDAEGEKPVSSTNTLEKEYQAEVNKQEDEQIQS